MTTKLMSPVMSLVSDVALLVLDALGDEILRTT